MNRVAACRVTGQRVTGQRVTGQRVTGHGSGLLRRLILGFLALLWLGSAALAEGFRYGPWDVDDLPKGAQESRQDGITAFQAGDVMYMFTPAEPLGNQTLSAVAQTFIADFIRGRGQTIGQAAQRSSTDPPYDLYLQTVGIAESSDALRVYMLTFFARHGQWGLAILAAPAQHFLNGQSPPMPSITFNPPELKALDVFAPPALPALPFPVPRTDRVALSQPGVDFAAARKLGLDAEKDLIPDVYDCYVAGQNRALSATPDLRLTVGRNGQYSWTSGPRQATGRWGMKTQDDRFKTAWFEGELVTEGEYIDDSAFGQGFEVYWKTAKARLYCAQQGPMADEYRLQLAKVLPGPEAYQCVVPGDPQPFKMQLDAARGRYTSARGEGRLRVALKADEYDAYSKPEAELIFNGGPLDLSAGQIEEDDFGNRILKAVFETSKGSVFYRETNTRVVAHCAAKLPKPRPSALYGQRPAPATGVKAPFDGVYLSLQNAMISYPNAMGGTYSAPGVRYELFYFSPNGYYLQDLDPTDQGTLPDCGRTKPNGDPLCERYQVNGNRILWEDSDQEWVAFQIAKDKASFQIADEEYYRILPFKDGKLTGLYSNEKPSFSSTPGALTMGGASTSGNFSNGYAFSPAGTFVWRSSSSSTTFVSPGLFNSGVSVTASSSSSDGGEGKYTLQGNWLTLNFTDGRFRKLYVYAMPPAYAGTTPELSIGGQSLLLQTGK